MSCLFRQNRGAQVLEIVHDEADLATASLAAEEIWKGRELAAIPVSTPARKKNVTPKKTSRKKAVADEGARKKQPESAFRSSERRTKQKLDFGKKAQSSSEESEDFEDSPECEDSETESDEAPPSHPPARMKKTPKMDRPRLEKRSLEIGGSSGKDDGIQDEDIRSALKDKDAALVLVEPLEQTRKACSAPEDVSAMNFISLNSQAGNV